MKKIYQVTCFVLFLLSLSFSVFAQNSFFTTKSEAAISLVNSKRVIIPNKYNTVQADVNQLKNFLWSLPSEKNVGNRNFAPILELPMPDGSIAKFHVWESSLMEPGLEAKFPEMKTFAGQGITDPYATIRLDYNPYFGFHAQVLSAATGAYYIDPYARGNVNNYISYFKRDNARYAPFTCETPDNPNINTPSIVAAGPCRGTELYTYRLALACTGEYAVAVCSPSAPTVPATAAAMLTTVNRVTGVYETEVSLRMILVANNNLLIYLDGATDPYTNNNGGTMLGQNQTNIDNIIGNANYDIGHVVSTGGGGVAQLRVPCVAGSKAKGVTGLSNPVGDNFDIDYVAHEMGHQWGGNHTFNSSASNCGMGNRNGSTAYEVGSGTTIQGYAGICSGDDIQPHSDPFFHTVSFDEISNYISTGAGFNCKVATATGNTLPVITAMNNNGASIPLNTPFTLTGTATDADNDPLTYCWEEWDLGPTTVWNGGNANTTSPLFKSRIPKVSGSRLFPDIAVILAGYPANPPSAMGGLKGETLPTQARALKFRLVVRDNRAGGGGVVTGGDGCQTGFTGFFQINTVAATGPFIVTVPNGGESYGGGSTQTITWNVAGTGAAPISCANVKISLSTDGGLTYPTVITASTPNDGSEALTIPNITTTTARVKIEAVGNIFFDISNADFNITPTPTFTFVPPAPATVTCGTATAAITLSTTSILGFVTPINLVASGLPGTTTVTYSVNPVIPGNSTVVTLNNVNTLAPGTYNITITGTAGAEVKTVQLTYIVSVGAGPAITVQPTPQTICQGLNTSFSVTSPTATGFQWQLSTTGAGGPWSNITNGGVYSNATTATLNITGVLATMDTYQYRCVASVLCGSTNSNAALLTVQTAPVITSSAANATICGGGSTTFCITATGTNITYQWQVSVTGCGGPWNNVVNGGVYSGGTAACLTINPTSPAMNGYGYRCVVNGTCAPPATSGCGLLTVNTPITITSQPASSTICAGAQTSFTVGVTGTSPTYQWQESTAGAGGPWTNITNGGIYSGATTAILTLTGVTAGMTGYQYRVVVSGAAPCLQATSNAGAILTVNTAPVITTQPVASTTLCVGGNTTFTAAASGTGVTYKWQLSTAGAGGPWADITNGGVYSGATTASLTLTGVIATMNGYQYRAVATGTCAPAANSNAAALTVNTPIAITTQPAANTNICATGSVSFTTVATGTSPSYQWQISTDGGTNWANVTNGGIFGGATTNTLTLTGITAAMNGNRFRTVVTGTAPCGAVNSNSAILNVTPQPVITASAVSLLAGQQSTLTVNVTPAPGLSFAWYLNGVLLPNATGNSIIATVNSLGSYRVIVTSATGSCQSELVDITALPSSKLFVFPSPNNGRFTVSYYTAGASVTNPSTQSINIYDSHGARVFYQEYKNQVTQAYQLHQIDMRRNGSGIYFIVLREANGNKIKTGKVVVR
ncbi:MAG: zinc-dependent metalloprotease family protein [Ferruginibacter sp.]